MSSARSLHVSVSTEMLTCKNKVWRALMNSILLAINGDKCFIGYRDLFLVTGKKGALLPQHVNHVLLRYGDHMFLNQLIKREKLKDARQIHLTNLAGLATAVDW